MRLFLASQDFGDHVDRLHEMVGDNKKALVIFNARDYKDADERAEVVGRKKELFENNGFDFTELDLRDYFGKEKQLQRNIAEHNPGMIFAIGGNYFILRRAFHESRLDEILKDDLADDKYVYGGSSAGSMIATPDLSYYDDQKAEIVPEGYKAEIIWDGLNLTNKYISPHQDQNWYKPYIKKRLKSLESDKKPYITLNDADVYIIDGDREEILK